MLTENGESSESDNDDDYMEVPECEKYLYQPIQVRELFIKGRRQVRMGPDSYDLMVHAVAMAMHDMD
eukprot:10031345-Lingulodinium_polyedra.AAC.1